MRIRDPSWLGKLAFIVSALCCVLSKQPACAIPISDGFDPPVKPIDGRNWWNAQDFGVNCHLGEDWNWGSGSQDHGKPVYSASHGTVSLVRDAHDAWGPCVIVAHKLPDGSRVSTLYGHLSAINVAEGQDVAKGQQVGAVGDAYGEYSPHLHFELRKSSSHDRILGPGYDCSLPSPWTDPSDFIDAHRVLLTPPGQPNLDVPAHESFWSRTDSGRAMHLHATRGGGGTPDSYRFHVWREGGGYDWYSGWVGGSGDAWQYSETLGSGHYWWSAQARNSAGEGPWQQYPYRFHINYPPGIPSLNSPTAGALVASRTVTCTWNDPGDPDNAPNNYRDYRLHAWKLGGGWDYDSGWGYSILTTYKQITVPSDGQYRWQVAAGDGWDSDGFCADRGFTVDTTPPVITLTGPAASTWISTVQQVTWGATDATSGVAVKTLTWDNGGQTNVSPAPIPEGKRTATVAATDNAGNSASQVFGPWWIDTTPPVPSVAFDPAMPDGENGWYVTNPIMSVSAIDPNGPDGSGVNAVYYTLDGSGEMAYTVPVLITGDGIHTYSARAADVAGNSTTTGDLNIYVDATPPVFDSINTDPESRSMDTLVAAWSCSDPDSGVWYYEYWIGTTPGRNDVRDVAITQNTWAYVMNLSLEHGQTYYFTVRARNVAGLWSDEVVSQGILAAQGEFDVSPGLNAGGVSAEARASDDFRVLDSIGQFVVAASESANFLIEHGYWHSEPTYSVFETIAAVKLLEDGRTAQLGTADKPMVVTSSTSVFADRFYVEQPDRAAGIACRLGAAGGPVLVEGDRVTVIGRLNTVSGERALEFVYPELVSHGDPLTPLFTVVPSIGGTGVLDGIGLNNVGLLMKTYGGLVSYRDPQGRFFYLDNGDNLYDGFGYGIRVICDGFAGGGKLAIPAYGQRVIVTGISSVVMIKGRPVRAIRPRRQADIEVAQ